MSKTVGVLLVIVGMLGVILLAFDEVLREVAPLHFSALIVFVVIDFLLAASVVVRPSETTLTLAVVWSLLRILIQVGDIVLGSTFDSEYFSGNLQFANYLFNPLTPVEDNPPGVPGAVLDLMLVLQLAVIGVGWKARRALKPATN